MLSNLKAALDSKRITVRAYADFLGISEKSVWNKMNEETCLTYPEAYKTSKELFPEYNSDYLFSSDGNVRGM